MSMIQALIGSFSNVLGAVYRVLHSLRLDGSGDYLNRVVTASNRTKWTWSAWVKKNDLGARDYLFSGGAAGDASNLFYLTWEDNANGTTRNNQLYVVWRAGSTTTYNIGTSASYNDTSAWYHVVLSVDTTKSNSSDRMKIYIDGAEVSYANDNRSSITKDSSLSVNAAGNLCMGAYAYDLSSTASRFKGQMSEVHFIDGTALDPTYFGETRGGQWVPKEVTGVTYGNNGFYLDFADSSTASALGTDASTNTNNFTVNGGITPDDQLLDSPNLRFATWDTASVDVTLSEGNLKTTHGASDEAIASESSALVGGKFYCELYWESGTYLMPQVRAAPAASEYSGYFNDGYKYGVEGAATYGSSYGVGSIIGCAVDATTSKVWWRLNGVWQGTGGGDPSSTLVPATSSGFTGKPPLYFALSDGTTANSTGTSIANFGQDHTFAGSKSPLASPFTDDDGNGEFYYQPPAGFKALATSY